MARRWWRTLRPAPSLRRLPAAQIFGAAHFFVHSADDRRQDAEIGDFRDYIRRHISKASPILEIGPSHSPIVSKRAGYNVTVLDHAEADELRQKFTAHGVDVSQVEPVDLVWRTGKFSDLMGDRKFEAVISSHVVEHAPDFVQFLQDSASILTAEGCIYIIAPDRRFCFDFFHAPSDPAKILADHIENRTRHSVAAFYRRITSGIEGELIARQIVRGKNEPPSSPFAIGNPHSAWPTAQERASAKVYVDGHENYFTPASFALLVEELNYLGQLDLRVDILTRARAHEFLAVLRKTSAPRDAIDPFARKKRMLHAIMLSEERERVLHGISWFNSYYRKQRDA